MSQPYNLITYVQEPFTMHSGGQSQFKLECAALTQADCEAAALWLLPSLGPFGSVEAVASKDPQAGWFADAFRPYITEDARTVLICDDLLTTGNSMDAQRAGRLGVGAVIFARGVCPAWIRPLLELHPRCRER